MKRRGYNRQFRNTKVIRDYYEQLYGKKITWKKWTDF